MRRVSAGVAAALLMAGCTETFVKATNADPSVVILSPVTDARLGEGEAFIALARVTDPESDADELLVDWSLAASGPVAGEVVVDGGTWALTASELLAPGAHQLIVGVVDPDGGSAEDTVSFEVVANGSPTASFSAPAAGSRAARGLPVEVDLVVSDDADDPTALTLQWGGAAVGAAGVPTHAGTDGHATFSLWSLELGTQLVSVTVTDGFGDQGTASVSFEVVEGDVDSDGHLATELGGDDCDDGDPSVYTGAPEICDDLDNDCNGLPDDEPAGAAVWHPDVDMDTFGDEGVLVRACERPVGHVADGTDCDDGRSDVSPIADEVCDLADNDCDTLIDEGGAVGAPTWWHDSDGDLFGRDTASVESCGQPLGYVDNGDDCDDGRPGVNPDELEICNELDDDCNGAVDDGASDAVDRYEDLDGDGWGTPASTVTTCDPVEGYAESLGDCDDDDVSRNDGATEVCDGVDNDCSGLADDGPGACPCEVRHRGSSPYLFCVDPLPWGVARDACYDHGYHMATINDEPEDLWLDGEVDSFSNAEWWIGLWDFADEGVFVWEDGSPVTWTHWHAFEPNDQDGAEDCAELNLWAGGTWNDKDCGLDRRYVCERD